MCTANPTTFIIKRQREHSLKNVNNGSTLLNKQTEQDRPTGQTNEDKTDKTKQRDEGKSSEL